MKPEHQRRDLYAEVTQRIIAAQAQRATDYLHQFQGAANVQ